MKNTANKQNQWILEIDFSQLMDLRIDYAFKLIFGTGDTLFLISLLNAIFTNKGIPRVITSLTVINPYLERLSKDDKLSVLDVRAKLDDGSTLLIEMHLYDIDDLKYKTIRSWARAYGEGLKAGEAYAGQQPVICVTFANGSLDADGDGKIHKCCKIMDVDDHTVFSDALELHYIDMKAFVGAVNETGDIGRCQSMATMLAKWLAVITAKDIKDKTIIRDICEEQEEIRMVVSKLVELHEDSVIRQTYQRRQDEIMLQNRRISDYIHIAEQERHRAQQERNRAEQESRRAEQAENALLKKDAAIADKDALIAELRSQLNKA